MQKWMRDTPTSPASCTEQLQIPAPVRVRTIIPADNFWGRGHMQLAFFVLCVGGNDRSAFLRFCCVRFDAPSCDIVYNRFFFFLCFGRSGFLYQSHCFVFCLLCCSKLQRTKEQAPKTPVSIFKKRNRWRQVHFRPGVFKSHSFSSQNPWAWFLGWARPKRIEGRGRVQPPCAAKQRGGNCRTERVQSTCWWFLCAIKRYFRK